MDARVSGVLLLSFITCVRLNPDPQIVFGTEGEDVALHFVYPSVVDYFLLYRVSAGGDTLLLKCRQSEDAHSGDQDVDCGHSFDVGLNTFFFRLNHVTVSQSEEYRVEGWTRGNVKEHLRSFRLTVCAEGIEKPSCEKLTNSNDDGATLCNLTFTEHNSRSSLQLYRCNALVLNTNVSLEPLVEDLRGRLDVDLKTSQVSVSLSGISSADATEFGCASFTGSQCQSYQRRRVNAHVKEIFAYEGERLTLPCIPNGQLHTAVYWDTPIGSVYLRDSQFSQQEVITHSQTGNYSLTISSLSKEQHSGWYHCVGRHLEVVISLYVCTKFSPLDVVFSDGESVVLRYNITEHDRPYVFKIQWYQQKDLQAQPTLISNNIDESVQVPEDLRGRLREADDGLRMSDLTAADSGLYTWRIHEDECHELKICSEGTIRLVHTAPSGVHLPLHVVYSPLIGCALLGQVAVVMWFCLRRRRRRRQGSERQSRMRQQPSGREDLSDGDG